MLRLDREEENRLMREAARQLERIGMADHMHDLAGNLAMGPQRLMEIAQNLIFEMHRPEPSAPWVARQTRKVNGGLAALERHYSTRVQNDLNGFDLGDIAVGTSLLLFEFAVSAGLTMPIDVLVWRGRYPAITKFLEVLEQRPSFVATRPETMVVDIGSTIS
jgi:glutathione S-transferase